MPKTALEFFAISLNRDRTMKIDLNQIDRVQIRFNEMTVGKDRDDDDVQEEAMADLIAEFELVNDETTKKCLLSCMEGDSKQAAADLINSRLGQKLIDEEKSKETEERAAALNALVENTVTAPQPPPPPATPQPTTTTTTTAEPFAFKSDTEVPLTKILCVVHQKAQKGEVKDFFSEYLFALVPVSHGFTSRSGENHPILDGKIHSLEQGSILDLLIRQQMADRGVISVTPGTTRCRVVEPITRTDEFDSWRFDHFHGLMDFWLTLDPSFEKPFPQRWRLTEDAQVEYIVTPKLTIGEKSSSSEQAERPNTKSLRNFIQSICRIEGLGQADDWYKKLADEENISTYSHLTNLNQREWERISKLPMNALKTIKFYIDLEKQMVEERRAKKSDEPAVEETKYSKAEMWANLHMIKLFINRQIEYIDGIENLPLIDAKCVKRAFQEMRDDGYEDDGLFPQMELFFQALAVSDEDLIINKERLTEVELKQLKEKKIIENELKNRKQQHQQTQGEIKTIEKRLEAIPVEEKKIHDDMIQEEENGENDDEELHAKITKWVLAESALKKEETEKRERLKKLKAKVVDLEKEIKNIELRHQTIDESFARKTTKINRRYVKPHRGFIMYGPPGTGKSAIMSQLAKKIGIAMVGPALAAGELERPYVGQSEAVILDLCMRANRLPHLICCLSIDEIDSLAPRRDDDSSEGKVAKISVLLSVIEGIKDVPNLMFFSATNRLHMMDEAFLRRMSGKFFVGRPSAKARKGMLTRVPKLIMQSHILEALTTATTNFSGAALKALTIAIVVDYISERREKEEYEIDMGKALELADRTAQQFQLLLGIDTLPRLLLYNLKDRKRLPTATTSTLAGMTEPLSNRFFLDSEKVFTGKVIVNLRDRCIRFEILDENNERRTFEEPLTKEEQNLQQLLERIASYGSHRNVQLLQLIDLNLLSSKGAYEEKKIFETLKDRYDECMQYPGSIIVYDLDSLIGVNKSESESSMGTSVSSAVVNQAVYIYVTSRFREAKIVPPTSPETPALERWAIAVARDSFLLNKFSEDVDFPRTQEQIDQEEAHRKRSKALLYCVKCRDHFVETENKMGSCTYHDGFLYNNLEIAAKPLAPSQATIKLHDEECEAVTDLTKKDELERKKNRYKYICCNATFQPGGGTNGCKKGLHGREKDDDGWEKFSIDAENYLAIKVGLGKWEKDCMDNIGYNRKYDDLLKARTSKRQTK